jgi:hypothetical protein
MSETKESMVRKGICHMAWWVLDMELELKMYEVCFEPVDAEVDWWWWWSVGNPAVASIVCLVRKYQNMLRAHNDSRNARLKGQDASFLMVWMKTVC